MISLHEDGAGPPADWCWSLGGPAPCFDHQPSNSLRDSESLLTFR
jgi:hypothetical protein